MSHQYSECDPRFRPLLADYETAALEHARSSVYGIWPDLTLAYLNPAWFWFSAENEGEPAISRDWTLGRNVMDSVPDPLRSFFEVNFTRCLHEGRPWEHTYECSSADRFRKFHQTVFPLGQAEGLLVVHSLLVESSYVDDGLRWPEDSYLDANGFRVQCCHCRRFRRTAGATTWDWVRPWVQKAPTNVSHGICESCLAFYFPVSGRDDDPPAPFLTSEL